MKNPLAETLAVLNNDPKVHHASGVGEERTLILDMIDEMWYGPQYESRSQPGAVSIGHASMYSDSASATESIAWSNTLNVMSMYSVLQNVAPPPPTPASSAASGPKR